MISIHRDFHQKQRECDVRCQMIHWHCIQCHSDSFGFTCTLSLCRTVVSCRQHRQCTTNNQKPKIHHHQQPTTKNQKYTKTTQQTKTTQLLIRFCFLKLAGFQLILFHLGSWQMQLLLCLVTWQLEQLKCCCCHYLLEQAQLYRSQYTIGCGKDQSSIYIHGILQIKWSIFWSYACFCSCLHLIY